MFVCIEGADADGHDFAGSAAEKGACAIVCSHMPAGLAGEERITVICTEDPRAAMAHMAAALYGFPAEELTLIGITGTKGKTTTAFMIAEILRKAGCKTGLIGTVCIDTGSRVMESRQTTPRIGGHSEISAGNGRQRLRSSGDGGFFPGVETWPGRRPDL